MNKINIFLENLEQDYQEAVIGKQISPEARKEVYKQKELHRKNNVKRTQSAPELHSISPLSKEKLNKVIQTSKKKSSDIKYYQIPNRDKKNKDDVNINPDFLWGVAHFRSDIINTLPFLYIPKTDELFYISSSQHFNDDKYNLRNYDLDNYHPASKFFQPVLGERKMRARTHFDIAFNIIDLNKSDHYDDIFLFKGNVDQELEPYITFLDENKLILGRYYNKMVSFWNKIDENLAHSLINRLQKHNQNFPVNQIYMPIKNGWDRR